MIQDNKTYDILEGSPRVTNCYGLHIATPIHYGNIAYMTGPVTASSERFEIFVKGISIINFDRERRTFQGS